MPAGRSPQPGLPRITAAQAMIAGRWGILVLAAMLAGLAPHAPGDDVHSGQNSSLTAPYLSVRGNHLVGRNGNIITLTGVNRSGAE